MEIETSVGIGRGREEAPGTGRSFLRRCPGSVLVVAQSTDINYSRPGGTRDGTCATEIIMKQSNLTDALVALKRLRLQAWDSLL